jgi:hypothetical protein
VVTGPSWSGWYYTIVERDQAPRPRTNKEEKGRKEERCVKDWKYFLESKTDTVTHSPRESARCHSSSLKYSDIVSQGARLVRLFRRTPDVFDKPDDKVIHAAGVVHALQRAIHVLRSQMQCSVRVCSRSLVIHAWPHDTEESKLRGRQSRATIFYSGLLPASMLCNTA